MEVKFDMTLCIVLHFLLISFIIPQHKYDTDVIKSLTNEQNCHNSFFGEMLAKIELMDSYSYTYIKGEIPDLFVMSNLNCDRTCDFIIMQCRTNNYIVEDSIYMSIFDLLCFNVTNP